MDDPAERDPSIEPATATVAAWSIVHGFATLWLNGDPAQSTGPGPEVAIRAAAGYLFRPGSRHEAITNGAE